MRLDVHRDRLHRHDEGADEGRLWQGDRPTNKIFKVEFCTVAQWKNGEILEEMLFYDLIGMMKQIGLT
ncbi:MAG: ester cyclase [Methanomassiliicoccales archaeon]|nr:ester cyclase [Methanomassiliicoccales archaeon]